MIGFVVPMEKEARVLIRALRKRKSASLNGRKLFTGLLGRDRCAIVLTGTGKIRSAAGAQLLLDHFDCDRVFHFGSAGALSPDLKIGDFVVASDIIEHDYIQKFGEEEDNPVATCHKALSQQLIRFGKKGETRMHAGRIVSGNEDIVTTSRRDELCNRFGGLSVDWESIGCALVCNINRVPVAVVRAISDYAYEHTHNEYSQNAVDVCAKICDFFIRFHTSPSG